LGDVSGLSREAIEALPAAVYMTDAEGRLTFYNEAAAALWGCRPELGDSKFCGSWKLYWPDGTPLPHDECPMAMALQQKRPIRGVEAIAERPDGTRIPFIPYPTPLFDATGRLTGAVNMLVDISERKRDEQALAERETQLAVFVEHAPAAIVMFDCEMRYLAVSRRFVVDYLPPGTQLLGRSHYEAFPNIPQRWRDIHARVLAGEELSQVEDQYTRYDGRTDWVRWSMEPWRRANGDVGGALLFAEIITEQVEAQRALTESEERLRLTQLQTGVGIWDRNLRTGKLTWTPELEAICGLEPGTVRCYADFRDLVHPDDIEAYEAQRDAAVQGRKTFNVVLRMIRPDGQIRWMSITGGAVYTEATGEPARILGNFVDITERKEAEEKLRRSEQAFRELLGALPAAIFVTDADGRITYYNHAAVELWGKRPELGKDRWFDLARPISADGKPAKLVDCPTEIALRKGKSVRGLEAILEREDGTRIPVIPYPTPLRDATGTIVGVVNMTVDISERQQAERTLAERNAQLALAGRAALVGSYVYDVNEGTMQVSEGYATIHGLPERTTETTISEWRSRVHPADLARAEGLREQAFADRRKEDNAEYRIVLLNGEVRWIERRGAISYGEDGRPERVVGVNIDVTERKYAEQQQRALNAELDHRVKNVLATVSAIISQTQEASRSRADFVRGLNDRITSLARTHELLSESSWRGASLAELIQREFAPYSNGNTEATGPTVTLKAESTQAVASVLHELTTNAAKYGALSSPGGRVSVRWRWLQNGSHDRLVIEWQEVGGHPTLAPSRSGYGTSVIRELIPFELGGAVELSFAPEGIRCRLEIPGEWAGRGRQKAEESGVLDSA
jgi:PAS domain S-box-containing protein